MLQIPPALSPGKGKGKGPGEKPDGCKSLICKGFSEAVEEDDLWAFFEDLSSLSRVPRSFDEKGGAVEFSAMSRGTFGGVHYCRISSGMLGGSHVGDRSVLALKPRSSSYTVYNMPSDVV